MEISISNIAWDKSDDVIVYSEMRNNGFKGLEIAPTRIISEKPYEHNEIIAEFSKEISDAYGFVISSMQSIWFGRSENLFESENARKGLIDYTKQAILFAKACGCHNLVFGSPKNRNMQEVSQYLDAIVFFKDLGDFAYENNTILSIEPNPAIYNTNFINNTFDAFRLVKNVNSPGFKVNVDVGTIIYNEEPLSYVFNNIEDINHIHISEPYLKIIEHRDIHKELAKGLKANGYSQFVSIEMAKPGNVNILLDTIKYIKNIFG